MGSIRGTVQCFVCGQIWEQSVWIWLTRIGWQVVMEAIPVGSSVSKTRFSCLDRVVGST